MFLPRVRSLLVPRLSLTLALEGEPVPAPPRANPMLEAVKPLCLRPQGGSVGRRRGRDGHSASFSPPLGCAFGLTPGEGKLTTHPCWRPASRVRNTPAPLGRLRLQPMPSAPVSRHAPGQVGRKASSPSRGTPLLAVRPGVTALSGSYAVRGHVSRRPQPRPALPTCALHLRLSEAGSTSTSTLNPREKGFIPL